MLDYFHLKRFHFHFYFFLFSINQSLLWKSDIDLITSAKSVCPNSANIQYYLGLSSKNNGDFSNALKYFEKATELDPNKCEVNFAVFLS